MKKIYTLPLAMMLASLPAMAQEEAIHAQRLSGVPTVEYGAARQAAKKAATRAESTEMTLGYWKLNDATSSLVAYGVNCSETGVGVMFPAEYLKNFVGNQITSINVAAPYNSNISNPDNYVYKNALTKAKIMVCNEMNGTPVMENDVTLGTEAFDINVLKFTTPYTIEADKDVYLYVMYEDVSANDYILMADKASECTDENAGYLYSKFKGFDQSGQPTTQTKSEWKAFAKYLGCNMCINASVTGDNLPSNMASPADAQILLGAKPGQPFDIMLAVSNEAINALDNVDITMTIGEQAPQTVNAKITDLAGGSTAVMYGDYGLAEAQFVCDSEGKNIPYTISISKVNGVDNSLASETYSGTMRCFENIYPTNVVAEELTSTTCSACPVGITGMERMREKYGTDGRFIPIAVHCPIPISGDPMNVCGSAAACYYGFLSDVSRAQGGASAPAAYVMRDLTTTVYPAPESLEAAIMPWLNLPSLAKVEATVAPTDDDKTVKLSVTVTPAIDDDTNYGISYTIVEDGVGPYRQSNGYSGASGDYYGWEKQPSSVRMTFNDVAREGSIYRPATDSSIAGLKKGEAVSWSTDVNVSAVTDRENYSIVAMLINKKTKGIENAVITKGVPSGIEAVAAEGKAIAAGVQGGVQMFTAGNIYTIDGRTVAAGVDGMVELPAGLYIVATPAGNAKVMVR